MVPIHKLVREVRRRSVWQVFVVYIGGGWLALEIVDQISERLALPEWIYGLALVLVIVGLPIVVATAFVQERPARTAGDPAGAPGSAPAPGERPAKRDRGRGRLRDLFTWRRAALGGLLALGLWGLAVSGWLIWGEEEASDEPALTRASTMVVLPLASAVDDTALARLGRELAITLSSNLNGVVGIRAADPLTVLSMTEEESLPLSLDRGASLAQELQASSLLQGTVVRAGSLARLDLTLYRTEDLERLADATVAGPLDDISALTDSATFALLRQIWRRGDAPTPNPVAVTTRSLDALQAYLAGERAVSEDRWDDAADWFARAIQADSSFWYAYWRYYNARAYQGQTVADEIEEAILEHRAALPEPDRMLIEARLTDALSERIEQTAEVTRRFPDYWLAWFDLGELMVHNGPYLGTTYADARTPLERTVALNPDYISGWEHLFWIVLRQRDTLASARTLDALAALRHDSLAMATIGLHTHTYYRFMYQLSVADGVPDPALLDFGVAELTGYRGPVPAEALATSVSDYGFHRAQILLANRILSRDANEEIHGAQHYGKALAWAARGAWDSALVSARRYVATTPRRDAALWAYGLAATGAWMGTVSAEDAEGWRTPAVRGLSDPSPSDRAELAWIDGLLAWSRRDSAALAAARSALLTGDADDVETLERSLAALQLELAGEQGRAADSLAALEMEGGETARQFRTGLDHPYLNAVNRLTAARWLLAEGDTLAADRLLTWHEAIFPGRLHRLAAVNRMLEGLAYFERAGIEASRGRTALARRYYRAFLSRVDAPGPVLQPLRDEAREALARTAGTRESANP